MAVMGASIVDVKGGTIKGCKAKLGGSLAISGAFTHMTTADR